MKEELRLVFKLPVEEAAKLLRHWLDWACRCRLEPFVKLARTIREDVPLIQTTLTYRLTNARIGEPEHQAPAHHTPSVRLPIR